MRFLITILCLILPLNAENLRVGWVANPPYQQTGPEGLSGLDIDLVRHILAQAGIAPQFVHQDGATHPAGSAAKHDIIVGVPHHELNHRRLRYSQAYRHEQSHIFFSTAPGANARVGRVHSPTTAMPAIAHGYETLPQMLTALQEGAIDAFIADPLAAGTLIWQRGLSGTLHSRPLRRPSPVVLGFGHTVSEHTIAKINKVIAALPQDATYDALYRKYHHPILLSQVVAQPWFFIIDIIGTIAFAISGVVIAYRERMTLFGAFVMALFPAVGGGTLRDLLVGRRPIFLIANPAYIYAVLATVLAGFLFIRFFANQRKVQKTYLAHTLEVFDALGLACFSVIGVWVACIKNLQPLCIWGPLLGVLTATGGSILRDLFRADHYYAALKGEFYPEISLFWSCGLTWFMIWQKEQLSLDQLFWAVIASMTGAFVMRLYVYKKGWKNRLLYRPAVNS